MKTPEATCANILDDYRAGILKEAISEHYGIGKSAINRIVRSAGAPKRHNGAKPWPETRLAELRRLCAERLPFSQIGDALGVTKNAALGMAHRLGITNERTSGNPNGPGKNPKRTRATVARSDGLGKLFRELRERNQQQAAVSPQSIQWPELVPKPLPAVTLLALTPYTCRWPIGDPRALDFGFCGCLSEPSEPYCRHHMRLAYRPPQPRIQKTAA